MKIAKINYEGELFNCYDYTIRRRAGYVNGFQMNFFQKGKSL